MAEEFECAWESLGPVPKVSIDFGNGKTLETTLGGNVLTSLCAPDGTVLDVLPGVVTPESYLLAMGDVRDLLRSVRDVSEELRETTLTQFALDRASVRDWVAYIDRLRTERARTNSLPGFPVAPVLPKGVAKPAVKRPLSELEPFPVRAMPPAPLGVAIGKSMGELPVVNAIAASRPKPGEEALRADDLLSTTTLQPQARAILCSVERRTPAEVTPHVFRLVLKMEVDDPYLGLGDALAGAPALR